jgi:hypothetical protein
MRARLYGSIVVRPKNFPDEIEVRLFPLRKTDGTNFLVPGTTSTLSYPSDESLSWDQIRRRYAVSEEGEAYIKAGEAIAVFTGDINATFPDEVQFPEGSNVTVLEE